MRFYSGLKLPPNEACRLFGLQFELLLRRVFEDGIESRIEMTADTFASWIAEFANLEISFGLDSL